MTSMPDGLDVRRPIGGLFCIVGTLLLAYGAATRGAAIYGRSLAINVNLWWGGAMLAFGLALLALSRRGRRRRE